MPRRIKGGNLAPLPTRFDYDSKLIKKIDLHLLRSTYSLCCSRSIQFRIYAYIRATALDPSKIGGRGEIDCARACVLQKLFLSHNSYFAIGRSEDVLSILAHSNFLLSSFDSGTYVQLGHHRPLKLPRCSHPYI